VSAMNLQKPKRRCPPEPRLARGPCYRRSLGHRSAGYPAAGAPKLSPGDHRMEMELAIFSYIQAPALSQAGVVLHLLHPVAERRVGTTSCCVENSR